MEERNNNGGAGLSKMLRDFLANEFGTTPRVHARVVGAKNQKLQLVSGPAFWQLRFPRDIFRIVMHKNKFARAA